LTDATLSSTALLNPSASTAGARGDVAPLTDGFGRAFHYLRLSLDDSCNFRCIYCLPGGYHKDEASPPLTADEIRRLAAGFAGMGFWKFRLTGGEPTVRRDFLQIARQIGETAGVRQVSLSTNGYRLKELAQGVKDANIHCVNVSVDSLKPERFERITGHDKLQEVLDGIFLCLDIGLKVKINVVLLKGVNDDELSEFLEFMKVLPVDVRFIELMPTADNRNLFEKAHLSAKVLVDFLSANGWREIPRKEGDGPARGFEHPEHLGKAGIIAPYAKEFCSTCNRLRVTSRGGLRLCLFAESDFSLRRLLQADDQYFELQQAVRGVLVRKEVSHYLPEGRIGNVKHFAMMGG
jgi:cyclic pyranopterin phosphate synthase